MLGATVFWSAFGTGGVTRPAAAPPEPELVGYAPTAPATGSMLRYETEYPTIPYLTGQRTDRVAALIGRLERGDAKLDYHRERGYLDSLLAALEIDPASQTLVYSQTSLQSRLIGPRTPRAIYFNDDVYVGYVKGAPLEIASLDPTLGPVFYLLDQAEAPAPTFAAELGKCLSCHDSYSLTGGGVPRFIVGSGYTGTTGMLVSHEGWILISDRTPLKSRWGGWYVTGMHGSQVHLGNMVIKTLYDFDRLEELRVGNVDTLDALVDVKPFPTNTSDIVALLVLQHQADVQNLITRLHYDARTAADKRAEPLEETAERLLRMMLFVDAVEYTDADLGAPRVRRAVREPRRPRRPRAVAARLRPHAAAVPLSVELRHLLARVRRAAGRREGHLLSAFERGVDRCRHQRGLRAPERRRSHRDSRDPARHETRRRGRRSPLTSCVARVAGPRPRQFHDQLHLSPSRLALATAFAIVYIVWGSTYLAILFAIETLPPFLMASGRFLIAGALLYAWSRTIGGAAAPDRVQWRATAVVGVLLLLGGNGLVVWSEQRIPSGVAALLVGTVPCFMVLLDWLRPNGPRPTGRVVAGLALGLLGLVWLVGPDSVMGGGRADLVGRRGPRVRVVLLGVRLDLLAAGADAGLAVPVDGDADARGQRRAARRQSRARRAVAVRRRRRLASLAARFALSRGVRLADRVQRLRLAAARQHAGARQHVCLRESGRGRTARRGVRGRSVDGADDRGGRRHRQRRGPHYSGAAAGISRYPCRAL